MEKKIVKNMTLYNPEKMSVRSLLIICSLLVLCNQCSPYFISRQIDKKEESTVEELKMAKLSNSKYDLNLLQFSMFGKSYSFKLNPANSIFSSKFQILQSKHEKNDPEDYQTLQDSGRLGGFFYTDEHGRGSFYIQQKNGKIELDGYVDDTFVISNSQGRHTATKSLKPKPEGQIDQTYNINIKTSSSKSTLGKKKLQHDLATVETLVFLDQTVHNSLVEKKASVKKYLGIFWNNVQNKYKMFSNPQIRFTLSGVIVLSEMSWMSDVFLAPNKPDDVGFITNFAKWIYTQKNNKFPQYDVAVLHTGLDLSFKDGIFKVNSATLGVAPTGGICAEDATEKAKYSICVVEDFYAPTYYASIIATHEIGHLLSSGHDDPAKCDDHGIMSPMIQPISVSTKLFCNSSVEQIKNHLKTDNASCLFDSPHPQLPIEPDVPIMTRDEICKKAYGDNFDALSTVTLV
uniref:Peptidase M12B domain-containing protein n=1 Tax=Strigamia maritima TaxID=126957 RepID=T1J940_STRMM